MRITPNIIYSQLNRSIDQTNETLGRLTEMLATNKKFLAPSEDVTAATRALDYKVSISSNDQYQQNIDHAQNRLKFTDAVLTTTSKMLSDIKDLANISEGAVDPATLTILSQQVYQYRDQLASVANSRYLGQYLFSGFRTDLQPYAAGTFVYQGDTGVMNVLISQANTLPVNLTGDSTFSYTLAAPTVKQLGGGQYVHYTPGAGTTVNVEIRDTTDTAVLDTFSFSNVIQMTDVLGAAIGTGNALRVQALSDPFGQVGDQMRNAQAEVGSRLNRLQDQTDWITSSTNTLKDALSSVEDANINEIAISLQKTNVALQALYAASSKIMQQSLFNFLT